MLGEALSYPRRGNGWLKRIGIGGLLYIFSFLIIPAIILQGYFLRVLRSAAYAEESAPNFGNWGGLLVDGLKVLVVSIAYLIIPYIVYFVAIFMLFGQNTGVSAVGLIITLVALVLVLVAAYVLPVALTNFALHDSMGAAFDFGTVFGTAFTARYFVAVVIAVVVGGLLSFIAALLSLLIVGIFLLFYLQIFIFYLYGAGCGPALVEDGHSTEQSPTGAVEY